jgi:hypothetical protein
MLAGPYPQAWPPHQGPIASPTDARPPSDSTLCSARIKEAPRQGDSATMLRLAVKCVAYLLIVLCVAAIIPMYWALGDTQATEFVYYADMPIGTIGLWLLRFAATQ